MSGASVTRRRRLLGGMESGRGQQPSGEQCRTLFETAPSIRRCPICVDEVGLKQIHSSESSGEPQSVPESL
eukprot:15462728-Alexandrium_andersonii.AAC.1